MKTKRITLPVGEVIPPPVTDYQNVEILRLRAQVFSPKLPKVEPYESSDKVVVR